jgi:hypothetical protein
MRRLTMNWLKDDRGIAMITAILVMLTVVSLSTVSFQLATHNLDQSTNERRSVQAIHASEAGLDRFLDYIANQAPIASPACSLPTEALTTSPAASFTVTATYYLTDDGTGTAYGTGNCAPPSVPLSAKIHSVGTSSGKTRTMEAFLGLSATPGGQPLTTGAVFAYGTATWSGSATILGNPDDADLYSVGDLNLSGGGTIKGNVSTQGNLTLGGTTDVKKDVVAKLSTILKGGAVVRGLARSSTSTISNAGTIYGNAYYCQTPAPGPIVLGSKIAECPSPTLPATRTFPVFTYDAAAWQLPGAGGDPLGYDTTHTFTNCTSAETFIRTGITDHKSYVVRINDTCALKLTGSLPIMGNLAIISNGDLQLSGGADFERASGAPNPSHLFLMFDILSPPGCTTTGISATGSTTVGSGIDAVLYTPCDVKFAGGAFSVTGQVFGKNVNFSSTSSIQYTTVTIPGANATGFREALRYRREITNS